MSANIRARLRQGQLLFGTLVSLNAPEAAELLAEAGFDWLFFDAEHGTYSARDLQAMLQAAGRGMACLVRVGAPEEAPIKQALDAGASGVIVPQVNSAATAADVVRWARYPPAGARGVGVARAQHYGFGLSEYLQGANDELLVVVQAESGQAAQAIDAIVQVPGLDAVLIGPYDLSASLGYPGQVEHPAVRAAIQHIADTCRAAGMPLGIFGLTAAAVRPYMEAGFRLIVAGIDTVLLGNAARQLLRELQA